MAKLYIFLIVLLALFAVAAGQQQDQVEEGAAHTKKVLAALDAVNNPPSESDKKIAQLDGSNVEYHHQVQKTDDKEVDRTARAVIDNPERQAYRERIKSQKLFTKIVGNADGLLKANQALTPKQKVKQAKKSKDKAQTEDKKEKKF